MDEDAGVIAVDHTGFSVTSLERRLQFWTEAMGFNLARRGEMGGEFLREATGVDDPRCRMALVTAQTATLSSSLNIRQGPTLGQTPRCAGAIGAAHIALTVADIRKAIARIETAGWAVKGSPQPIQPAPMRNNGRVHLWSGCITIELMQPPVQHSRIV